MIAVAVIIMIVYSHSLSGLQSGCNFISVCSRRSNFSIMADIKLFEEKNLSITTTFLLLENKVFSINSRIIFYFFENSRELNVYSLIYFYYIISPLMRYFADCFYNLVRLKS